ncbi:hypothetical protein [Corynebacterium kalidii]|uniref:Uncharacterized protein n=1 Tax=Corynebacterium kalidii TaxID=2931982 RepID=A0A9X2B1N2_9CORY|nr:hypothetical protein [Corynebacterium kalidii]MCJ7857925.1 hypothetical protein [Corynebacterium kalidii]
MTVPGPAEPSDPAEGQLERILVDAEDALRALREELAEHRRSREQHDAVDQLPHLINASTEKWANTRLFLEELLEELRANRQGGDLPSRSPRAADSPRHPQDPGRDDG